MYDRVNETAYYIKNQTKLRPLIGIVLGSGLTRVVDEIENKEEINDLGLFEYLYNKFIIIEWPELIMNDLDINHSILKIDFIDTDKRKINLTNISSSINKKF